MITSLSRKYAIVVSIQGQRDMLTHQNNWGYMLIYSDCDCCEFQLDKVTKGEGHMHIFNVDK